MRIFLIIGLLINLTSLLLLAEERIPESKRQFINIYPVGDVAKTGELNQEPKLDDWKSEAFVEIYEDTSLKDRFLVKVAFAYDFENLYIAAEFIDESPLVNKIHPGVEPSKGWSGDSFQIRIIADSGVRHPIAANVANSDIIIHLTMWLYSELSLPAVDVRYGMNYQPGPVLIGNSSGLVFKKSENVIPGGYIMKAKIPWKAIGVKTPPSPGDKWVMTIQPLWANQNGDLVHHFFDCISRGAYQFEGTEGWGEGRFLSLGQTDVAFQEQVDWQKSRENKERAYEQIHKARNTSPKGDKEIGLTAPKLEKKDGILSITYTISQGAYVSMAVAREDGYLIKTLLTKEWREKGIHIEEWKGQDEDGEDIPTGKYKIKMLAHHGITPRYVTTVMNSGTPSWRTEDGKGSWGGDHGNPVDIATDKKGNKYILWSAAEAGDQLICLDVNDQKQWGIRLEFGDYAASLCVQGDELYVGTFVEKNKNILICLDAKTGERKSFENGQKRLLLSEVKDMNLPNLGGITSDELNIYCALEQKNRVLGVDRKSGKPKYAFEVKSPRALAINQDRSILYVMTADKVMPLDLKNAKLGGPIITGLDDAQDIVLTDNGRFLISQRGKTMQVGIWTEKGMHLNTIGIKGGRPNLGRYKPEGLLNPKGLSVDNVGGVWVAEDDSSPKRVSLWDMKTGKLLNEFFGGTAFAARMTCEPDNPENVYLHYTRFIVDYETGKVIPDAVMIRPGVIPRTLNGPKGWGLMGQNFEFVKIGNGTYAYDGFGGVYKVEKDRLKAFAYFAESMPNWGMLTGQAVFWVDRNADGQINTTEIREVKGFKPDLVCTFGGGFFKGGAFVLGRKTIISKGVDNMGLPIYEGTESYPDYAFLGNGSEIKIFSNRVDTYPSVMSDYKELYTITSLPASDGSRDGGGKEGVYKFNQSGKILWRYPKLGLGFGLTKGLSKPGDLFGAQRFIGLIQFSESSLGEVIGVGCSRGYFGFLDHEGLFIDQIGHDLGSAPKADFDVFQITNFGGYVFRHPKTGKVYLFCGDTDGRILELQGWESIQKIESEFKW